MVRLDPPESKEDFLKSCLGFETLSSVDLDRYETLLVNEFIETIRFFVTQGLHSDKKLYLLLDRVIFQRHGYVLPDKFTIGQFLNIVQSTQNVSSSPVEDEILRGFCGFDVIEANRRFGSRRGLSHVEDDKNYRESLVSWMEKTFGTERKVLSLGTGKGVLEGVLKKRDHQVVCVEYDEAFAQISLRENRVETIVADARKLPVRKGIFDLVLINESLGTMGLDILKPAVALLQKRGSLLVVEYPCLAGKPYRESFAPIYRIPSHQIAGLLHYDGLTDIHVETFGPYNMALIYGNTSSPILDQISSSPVNLSDVLNAYKSGKAEDKHKVEEGYLEDLRQSDELKKGIINLLKSGVDEVFSDSKDDKLAVLNQILELAQKGEQHNADEYQALEDLLSPDLKRANLSDLEGISRIDEIDPLSEPMVFEGLVVLPSDRNLYVIGDTHGDSLSTEYIIGKIRDDLETGSQVVFLGTTSIMA